MRIDYSPPKQSCVTSQSKPRPRKEPVGMITSLIIITGLIAFAAGFGAGWFFSQKSAKKAFQAATEQSSIENAPKPEPVPPQPVPPKPEPSQTDASTQQPQPATTTPQTTPGAQSPPDPQLSFYKTLPGGQKTNPMGSGVNAKDEKVKQPLQAAIPSNITRKPQVSANTPKPVPEKPAPAEKTAAPARDSSGFTVQVASYSLKSEAEATRSKLAGKGYNVIINESNQGDKGIWYRVRVGKKLEHDAAKELAGKIGKGAIAIPERE
ncbi:MAG: SPOR domain-containing protein [Desulfuromonadales bacterium]|nr:SPOR domain-containing protein [Desulfuromonadales bacterium]